MDTESQSAENAAPVFALGERMTPQDAVTMTETLREMQGQDLTVDASAVKMIPTPCLQVLLAAAASWARDNKSLTVTNPSSAFTDILAMAGIDADLLHVEEAA